MNGDRKSSWRDLYNTGKPAFTYFVPMFFLGILLLAYFDYLIFYVFIKLIFYDEMYVMSGVFFVVSLLIMTVLVTSFLKTVYINPGKPKRMDPAEFQRIMDKDEEKDLSSIQGTENSVTQELTSRRRKKKRKREVLLEDGRKICVFCKAEKPDRCHHCSYCERCVLKQDHHCGVFNNCIGLRNYKFFVLTLLYLIVGSFFVVATLIPSLIESFTGGLVWPDYLLMPVGFAGFFFGLSMTMFLVFHMTLICFNVTTIENIERRSVYRNSVYNIGVIRNCQQALGANCLFWLFPFCAINKGKYGNERRTNY